MQCEKIILKGGFKACCFETEGLLMSVVTCGGSSEYERHTHAITPDKNMNHL